MEEEERDFEDFQRYAYMSGKPKQKSNIETSNNYNRLSPTAKLSEESSPDVFTNDQYRLGRKPFFAENPE